MSFLEAEMSCQYFELLLGLIVIFYLTTILELNQSSIGILDREPPQGIYVYTLG